MIQIHKTLLHLKIHGNEKDHSKVFSRRVVAWLQEKLKLVPEDQDVVLTIAPGHSPTSLPSFVHNLVGMLLSHNPRLIDGRQQLVRIKDVPKQAYSKEKRTRETHRNSIRVDTSRKRNISTLNRGRVVFILDDVWTSGCTLSAYKEKIMETGATGVILLAIGKTVI